MNNQQEIDALADLIASRERDRQRGNVRSAYRHSSVRRSA
jgi:hypothetical protein